MWGYIKCYAENTVVQGRYWKGRIYAEEVTSGELDEVARENWKICFEGKDGRWLTGYVEISTLNFRLQLENLKFMLILTHALDDKT